MKRAALIALVLLSSCKSREMKMSNESKVDVAKLRTTQFAREAFPMWKSSNASKPCPDNIEQLAEYMDSKSTKDPWAHDYKLVCGPTAPAGVTVGVLSFGEDGKEGTSDDIKSWE
jgi:hypothetical protein